MLVLHLFNSNSNLMRYFFFFSSSYIYIRICYIYIFIYIIIIYYIMLYAKKSITTSKFLKVEEIIKKSGKG
jgi:hypothetical protein